MPMATARCTWALGAARDQGIEVDAGALSKAANRLRSDFQRANQSQDELKAVVQHALTAIDQGDFAALNRLHRERQSLSNAALVATALGTCVMTTMAIVARRNEIDFSGASVEVEKHMNESPRRIGKLPHRPDRHRANKR